MTPVGWPEIPPAFRASLSLQYLTHSSSDDWKDDGELTFPRLEEGPACSSSWTLRLEEASASSSGGRLWPVDDSGSGFSPLSDDKFRYFSQLVEAELEGPADSPIIEKYSNDSRLIISHARLLNTIPKKELSWIGKIIGIDFTRIENPIRRKSKDKSQLKM